MIIGIGIDIVEITRIKSAIHRWGNRFAERILTLKEVSKLRDKRDSQTYIASRFAAKEAFLKALGTGYAEGISWHDMEVVRKEGQRPSFNISGRALEIMNNMSVGKIHLSISHEKKYAVAQVILEE